MKNTANQGWIGDACTPSLLKPLVTFSPIYAEGRKWFPNFGDRHALLLLKRRMPKSVSFLRAYRGWRASGAHEERELGEGRAFLRWLQKHELAVDWTAEDFKPHLFFQGPDAPKHDPKDELARDHSFAIKPVEAHGRAVKLYVQDTDMLSILNLPYGHEEDFLELVRRYVAQRFDWEKWRAPAPCFLDWVVSQGKRPAFRAGQVGLCLLK